MSLAEERVARSVALEKAYVHDVYEEFPDGPRGKPWPKVNQFLADLEPGSLVCDVGCGNGKYLNVNPTVFNIGADKCCRLTKVAKEKENEVLICDNLALPFRDESFDAVLSVAVVHHFATTERRVCALRELARVLRIGGRLIISVWAMEQTNRKFESQDVLVPWHRPHTLSTPSLELTSTTNTSEEDALPPYHAYTQTSDSDSRGSVTGAKRRGRTRHKGRSIDPGGGALHKGSHGAYGACGNCSTSPSSSSLSSPNETCYSFVRRAIQKLAGGKRSGSASHRPWFLETWNSCTKDTPPNKRYDPDGCESLDCANIHDLPIELRRVDDEEMPQRRQTFPSHDAVHSAGDLYGNLKSKSLTDIKTFEDRLLVRSQSSVPSLQLEAGVTEAPSDKPVEKEAPAPVISRKPRLVKQKQSICDEDADEALDKATDMRDLVSALPEFRAIHGTARHHRGNVCKQNSMNEELMSTERLREKERVKRNIQKQASLNEELIYQRHTLDSLRDSIFTRRFQLIKSGFTNTLKNSTNNIEKVAGSSLKNGFVRMFQGWKSGEQPLVSPTSLSTTEEEPSVTTTSPTILNPVEPVPVVPVEPRTGTPSTGGERRHSREDGSDSSKDSSLQSDTSVDSEDSFASVIFVPKPESVSPVPLSPGPVSPGLRKHSSVPNSPRIKQSSCPTSPRIKQTPLTVYPLTKQLSSPKPSTTSCKNPTSPNSLTAHFKLEAKTASCTRDQVATEEQTHHEEACDRVPELINESFQQKPAPPMPPPPPPPPLPSPKPSKTKNESLAQKYSVVRIPKFKKFTKSDELRKPLIEKDEPETKVEDKKRSDRIRQIRELLNQRPGFGIRSSRSAFPIVRNASTHSGSGRSEATARPLPRLLSLELFNPETDDKDSDSSGVSSPDSVDSVINIDVVEKKQGGKADDFKEDKKKSPSKFPFPTVEAVPTIELVKPEEDKTGVSPTSARLLEAAANVANSLDEAVDAVIKSSPRAKRRQFKLEAREVKSMMERQYHPTKRSPEDAAGEELHDAAWDVECHRHLTDFADKLSEKLLMEIDQYQEQTKKQEQKELMFSIATSFQHIDDPYIHRLSEELQDLNKLSAEIQKQNQYLSKLGKLELGASPLVVGGADQTVCWKCRVKQCKCSERIHSNSDNKLQSDQVPYSVKISNKDIAETKPDCCSAVEQGSFRDSVGSRVDVPSPEEVPPITEAPPPPVTSCIPAPSLSRGSSDASEKASLRCGHSLDSNDTADVSERTTASLSDSQRDTSRCSDGGSTASLVSCAEWGRRGRLADGRSSSEDAHQESSRPAGLRREAPAGGCRAEEGLTTADAYGGSAQTSLSDTSQDSLPSDIGGAITYHRYYHVFREGELDQLIERYVENLHIISSYYDHASWCVVAEKVQVWTI